MKKQNTWYSDCPKFPPNCASGTAVLSWLDVVFAPLSGDDSWPAEPVLSVVTGLASDNEQETLSLLTEGDTDLDLFVDSFSVES